ncbi:hypothetical protein EWM64_g7401 [Hericium alpestre]|uniref:Uncharacterized protein n=1 Tax=Hericium alpestre TaxID=135208 RepID=A0A4Y9ZS38_9AGAM|nr:hypothetical protein EWM64_g7401 [Hericium alpestre]
MQLMLVYRFLRQISEWTLSDFYTEVYVKGTENVPLDGPVLLLASHPNETIDVAALSATIKEGAARAALEYVKTEKERTSKDVPCKTNLVLAPVGILYTDKAKYLSRIYIQYGSPIPIDSHVKAYLDKSDDSEELAARAFITHITSDIWKEMQRLTIDAPDWKTFHAAEIAREILWQTDDNVSLESWFDVTQT